MKLEKWVIGFKRIFEDSFINDFGELIINKRTNLYFRIDNIHSKEDFVYKILSWCSRDASKAMPFSNEHANQAYRKEIREGLNEYLGVCWEEEQWLDIYENFGNGIHEDECRDFIRKNQLSRENNYEED